MSRDEAQERQLFGPAPRLSEIERGSAAWLEVQEAQTVAYERSWKLHLLSTGRWAILDQRYVLRAIVDTIDGLDSVLRELWDPAIRPAGGANAPVTKPPSSARAGKININLDDLFSEK